MWPGTGRVVRVVLHGLTRREISAATGAPGVLSVALHGDLGAVWLPPEAPDLNGYVALAGVSGFPEPLLRLPPTLRRTWLDSYVEHVVTRDIVTAGRSRDPVRLRGYLEALALSTAGLPTDTTLYEAAGIDKRTADAYDGLLSALFLLDLVPTWTSNRLSRLVKRSKRYLVDPAVAMAAARIDETSILSDPDPDLLGRILDTFVVAQLRPEIDLLQPRARLHHLRTEAGRHEVDIVIDLGAGRLIAAEVKATSAPTTKDARHLAWLREELGESFVRGIVFHTGRQPFELDTRIWALPIATLWA